MTHQEALTAFIASFVSELTKAGVRDVVVSPGSRSTPMAMIMAEHPDLRVHIQIDERSAAFFALGIAKATHEPVALLCTSGTAAANYYPAIIEARYSRVPLIVLTADRPHELREVGAPQAIDQIHLYGQHVKWFMEMALPERTSEMLRYSRSTAARSVVTAKEAPAGPVHLNFPFREPLIPNLDNDQLFIMEERENQYVSVQTGRLSISDDQLKQLASEMKQYSNGIIVCGSLEQPGFAEAVTRLSSLLKFPIVADPLSQLRSGSHNGEAIIDTYDTFLRIHDVKKKLQPEVIIRFGAMPVSKALLIFLKENHQARHFVIDGGAGWRDPAFVSTDMLYCNETVFCNGLSRYLNEREADTEYKTWIKINEFTRNRLNGVHADEPLTEGKVMSELVKMLPQNATLFVGNSMPIRDLDSFFHYNNKNIRIMANRGANGIDGIVSTALGAATVCQPLYLVVGDLTFFHDLNGLLAAKLYSIDIHIIVINNNGGGIFSFLPQSSHPKHFEFLFGTPIDLDFKHAARLYNGHYENIADMERFSSSFVQNMSKKGLRVSEITINRDLNVKMHREMWENVSQEILEFLQGEC